MTLDVSGAGSSTAATHAHQNTANNTPPPPPPPPPPNNAGGNNNVSSGGGFGGNAPAGTHNHPGISSRGGFGGAQEFTQHVDNARNAAANGTAGAQQTGGSGSNGGTSQAVDTVVDPAAEIARLNSDGDRVVMSMTGEGKLQMPVPVGGVPLGIGGKAQYGFEITVEQVGDTPAPGSNGEQPAYEVTFDKNLLGGATVEPPIPGIDPAAELNLRTSGSVTMRFDTQEEAARAVNILQRLALEETVRDAGNAISPAPDLSNPLSNPVTDDGGASLLPQGPNPLADALAPSDAEMTFLRDHVVSYTQAVGAQERGKIAAKAANLGIELRIDGNQWITRTVTLPRNGEPGSITYTISGDLDPSVKEKFTVGKQEFDQLEIGYVPQNIVELGTLTGEVSLTWNLPDTAFDSTVSGQPVPELSLLADGTTLGAPDEISARLQLDYMQQSPLDLSRTDMRSISIDAAVANPGPNAGPAIGAFLEGDLEGAFRGLGDDLTVTVQNENIRRDGVNQQHEVGVEMADVLEGKVSLIGEIGLDDVTSRTTRTFDGNDIADRLWGPERASVVGDPPPGVPQAPTLVVVPNEGLNIRQQPSSEAARISAFSHGTFVQATGQQATDAQGRAWVEVSGYDANDRMVQGWVAADFVRPHDSSVGAMDGVGRINPQLEAQGYQAHIVQPGDTVWDLAHRDGGSFQEMMQLNSGHLINPGMIFPGDKVYIPGTGQPAAVAEPPAPTQPDPDQTSPSDQSDASTVGDSTGSTGSGTGANPSDDSNGSLPGGGAPSLPGGGSGPVTPTPPTQTQSGAPAATDLDIILRDYQVADDPGGMIDWTPRGNIIRDVAGRVFGPERMTATEGQMLDGMNELELADMMFIQRNAWDTSAARFPAPDAARANFPNGDAFNAWAGNDGHQDAFRHAYWNALMTRRFGAEFTERFATAHEGSPSNYADREAMDLYNNEVGRRIATENPNASEAELADLVAQALQEGELIVIDGGGRLAWSDQVPFGQHGRGDDAPAPGVIPTPGGGNPDSSLSGHP